MIHTGIVPSLRIPSAAQLFSRYLCAACTFEQAISTAKVGEDGGQPSRERAPGEFEPSQEESECDEFERNKMRDAAPA